MTNATPTAAQTITSARTSRKQVPALLRALVRGGVIRARSVNVDLGGGRFDDGTAFVEAAGARSVVFDPYNRGLEHNQLAVQVLLDQRPETATVSNVLNVIKEPQHRASVIWLASRAKTAYFTVYEGDRSGRSRATRDGWQEHRKLASYVPEIAALFETVEVVTIDGLRVIRASGAKL